MNSPPFLLPVLLAAATLTCHASQARYALQPSLPDLDQLRLSTFDLPVPNEPISVDLDGFVTRYYVYTEDLQKDVFGTLYVWVQPGDLAAIREFKYPREFDTANSK
jgi:hypothetical protein